MEEEAVQALEDEVAGAEILALAKNALMRTMLLVIAMERRNEAGKGFRRNSAHVDGTTHSGYTQ